MSQLTTNTTTIESLITAINELPEPETVELQEKTISPTTSSQIVSPDDGYGGLSKVTVNAMPAQRRHPFPGRTGSRWRLTGFPLWQYR